MLETINLELFGAFSGILGVLIWLVRYFKKAYEDEKESKKELVDQRLIEAEKEKQVLEATLEVLRDRMEEVEDQK